MKRLLTLISTIGFILIVHGQPYNLERRNIKELRLKQIIEWTINIDSVNNRTDSSCKRYLYDSLGRLTEMNYEFSKDGSSFVSVKYLYNEKGFLVDSIETNPYSVFSSSITKPVDSIESIMYDYSRISSMIRKWKGGNSEVLKYNYGRLFFVNEKDYLYFTPYQSWKFMRNFVTITTKDCFLCKKDKAGNSFRPVYDKDLVDFIEININDKLRQEIRYEYTF